MWWLFIPVKVFLFIIVCKYIIELALGI